MTWSKHHIMNKQVNIFKVVMLSLLVSGLIACQRNSSSMNGAASDTNQTSADSTVRGSDTKLELAPNQIRATERGGSLKQEAIKIDTANQQSVPATRFSSKP